MPDDDLTAELAALIAADAELAKNASTLFDRWEHDDDELTRGRPDA